LILSLTDAHDASELGGKATQLGAAMRAGLPVPGGWALTPDTVEAVVRGDRDTIDRLAEVVAGTSRVAVRSSALDEDSADASFAGAHLSVLGVAGIDAVIEAVRAVHASASDDGAQGYRSRLGLARSTRMAVVVQRLVDADVAGVLFTRHPVTGADERVVEASWGLGEVVVAGLVTPDSFRIARGGAVLERVVGDKDLAIRACVGPDGSMRTEEVGVDPELASTLCLRDAELTALDDLATRCDEVYGSGDHDIEFAFDRNGLHLLQRRPITRA
jgi:pyruvate,water dikinase